MKQGVFLFAGLLLGISLTLAVEPYVSCLRCDDVASPSDCRQYVTCGAGEICFAREFKDQHGLQGYRLGCEEEARCDIFFNAKHLIGKRSVVNPDPAPADGCYECCTGDNCNRNLCQGKGGAHVPLTPQINTACPSCTCPQTTCPTRTSTPCPTYTFPQTFCLTLTSTPCPAYNCPQTNCPTITSTPCWCSSCQNKTDCPASYYNHNQKCYFFSNWTADWDDARSYCKDHGGDLVSINSQEEQDFLVRQLTILRLNAYRLWTGGVYVPAHQAWEWVDGSPFAYTYWQDGYPKIQTYDSNWHVVLLSPMSYIKQYWQPETAAKYAFICENQKLYFASPACYFSPSLCVLQHSSEICSVHEIIDHNGLIGYRLGCEHHQVCSMFQQLKSLIGKRDNNDDHPAPSGRCYECCATDECNKDLCQQYSGNNSHGVTTQPTPSSVTPQVVSCMSCQGVESPEHCRQNTVCGEDEICFTREYTDHQGLHGFRLGCESKARCSLFLNAASLFGKRQLPEPAPPEGCYACCSSDECNTGLCRGSSETTTLTTMTTSTTVTIRQTTTTTTHPPTTMMNTHPTTTMMNTHPTTTIMKGCPSSYVMFRDHCYFFATWEVSWSDARAYCKNDSGDLVSVNTQADQNFLEQQLHIIDSHAFYYSWTGGYYSLSFQKWEWVDKSPMVYTNSITYYPKPTSTAYIIIGNPVMNSDKGWSYDSGHNAFICEKHV